MSTKLSTAVVLAAGLGARLGPLGRIVPKGFIRIGDAAIISESLSNLLDLGIRRVIVVTGHLANYYDRLPQRFRRHLEFVHNPDYFQSGTMCSLACARQKVDGDFLLLESDIIYEKRALDSLISTPYSDVILLSGPTAAGDEVLVETKGKRLLNMSKDRSTLGTTISGEFVGISRISPQLFCRMLDWSAEKWPTSRQCSYETDCLTELANIHPIYCHLIGDLLWAEIDNREQLIRARSVYHAIRSKQATSTAASDSELVSR